jgi:hypothetical protein
MSKTVTSKPILLVCCLSGTKSNTKRIDNLTLILLVYWSDYVVYLNLSSKFYILIQIRRQSVKKMKIQEKKSKSTIVAIFMNFVMLNSSASIMTYRNVALNRCFNVASVGRSEHYTVINTMLRERLEQYIGAE